MVTFRGIEVRQWNNVETCKTEHRFKMRLDIDGVPRTFGCRVDTEYNEEIPDNLTLQILQALVRSYTRTSGQTIADRMNEARDAHMELIEPMSNTLLLDGEDNDGDR